MLLEENITVVLNVKRSVLEKVARFIGACIVPSIELLGAGGKSAVQPKSLRTKGPEDAAWQVVESGRFRVLMDLGQEKPLVHIDVPKRWSGPVCCTALVRGGTAASLTRAKASLLFATYAYQCIATEVSFLHSCGGQVPQDFQLIRDQRTPPERSDSAGSGSDLDDPEPATLDSRSSPEPSSIAASKSYSAERVYADSAADSTEFHVMHLSPFFAFLLPQECCRWLQRVVHQKRTAEILQNLTEASDHGETSSDDGGSQGETGEEAERAERRRELLSDAFTIHEIGGRDEDGKPHHRLSVMSAERAVELAAAQGLLWTPPGSSLDSATMDTLRVLGSSALPGGDAPPCIEPSEMWIRFQGDGDASLGEYLRSYCFNPRALCPAKGCGLPVLEHEHSFVHGAARVRVRVSQRTPHGGGGRSADIVHRMRCVTCARMTSCGAALTEAALRLSFGRFLQALLYERSLLTADPECPHPLHEQLHSFSQGTMTALFVTEPVTLFEVLLPPLRMEPVPEGIQGRLGLVELTEVEAAAQRLLGLAETLGGDATRLAQAQVDALAAARRAAPEQGLSLEQAAALRRSLFHAAELCLADGPAAGPPSASPDPASGHDAESPAADPAPPPPTPATPGDTARYLFGGPAECEADSDSSDDDACDGGDASAPPERLGAYPRSDSLPLMSPHPRGNPAVAAAAAAAALSAAASTAAAAAPNPLALARLLTGGTARRAGRVSGEVVQAHLEGCLLSTAVGHCCHVAVSDASVGKAAGGGEGVPAGGGEGREGPAVYEDEPSSIIAYALASRAYADALAVKERAHAAAAEGGLLDVAGGGDVKERLHVKVAMESEGLAGRVQLRCKVYLARQFAALRRRYCGGREEEFVAGLRRCRKWVPTGGKSCAGFVKTADDRFVLKDLAPRELRHLLASADRYFEYLDRTLGPTGDGPGAAAALPSCLVKVVGVFKAEWRHVRSGRSAVHVVIVMENLWYTGGRLGRPVSRIFDLKGSARNRFVKEAKQGDVQLDDNFHAYLQRSPLLLSEAGKRLLSASVYNDTVFLTALNVMDYSLLVGVDEAAGRLVVGIIDYMRPYTMDKQAEFYYKSAMDRVALKPTLDAPTVIPPPEYRQRFRHAMARDFLAAPSKFSVLRHHAREHPPGSAHHDRP